ncbi:hypothetical protein EU811_21380 [Arthrobacter sp. TS-15]|uniref:hypothetical protein n=1 Tax=Arthrobacter sp. TS-15 TaxID=2510797 RepID=UPI00115E973E|nr:hypothetical protein [Arthrobacter sp. TS-15]TQS88312.1 hypothetical protein EU811_21380 [Arthrobacter sp. TS-15]
MIITDKKHQIFSSHSCTKEKHPDSFITAFIFTASLSSSEQVERDGSHLPGTPLVGEDGGTDFGLISRGGLFRLAGPARQDDTGPQGCTFLAISGMRHWK